MPVSLPLRPAKACVSPVLRRCPKRTRALEANYVHCSEKLGREEVKLVGGFSEGAGLASQSVAPG